MIQGPAHKYYNHGLKVGESIRINKLVCNKYSINDTSYLVIAVNQVYERFPCAIISNHGELFFFSGYETV